MDKETLKKKMGIGGEGSVAVYKLNKVSMSGDDGTFKLSDLISERAKGEKVVLESIGKEITGVILKMRWALTRYDEPSKTFYRSTEYDNKWNDTVTIYPSKEKGAVPDMKDKYKLSTIRIVYFYLPAKQQVVRLEVKASALSGEKNPNGELGLFQYIDSFTQEDILPCEYLTVCKGVFREGKNDDGSHNKRKDHFAMTFSRGNKLTESQYEKAIGLLEEVDARIGTKSIAEEPNEEPDEDTALKALDAAIDGSDPDRIPF